MKKEELQAILRKDGIIYVNTYAQDCDGVSCYGVSEFETIQHYNEAHESFIDSLEGRASWDVVAKKDTYTHEECGTFGHGWDIN